MYKWLGRRHYTMGQGKLISGKNNQGNFEVSLFLQCLRPGDSHPLPSHRVGGGWPPTGESQIASLLWHQKVTLPCFDVNLSGPQCIKHSRINGILSKSCVASVPYHLSSLPNREKVGCRGSALWVDVLDLNSQHNLFTLIEDLFS